MNRIVFIVIAAAIVLRLFITGGLESAAAGAALVIILGTLIWFSDFWAVYILPFGFWESKATDFKNSQRSADALVFLGWVSLLVFGVSVFLN